MAHPKLHLESILTEPFGENTFVAHLEGRQDCLVFDPGLEPPKILSYLDRHQLLPAAILNTHGHVDHIGGNAALKERWPDVPLIIGAGDAEMLTDPMKNLSGQYGFAIISPPADQLLHEGETWSGAGFDLEVLEIPGHSPGHIVFVWQAVDPPIVFGGDVLFAGSVGRTDFPWGSFEQLKQGIQEKLFPLPDDTVVLPGHGPATTIGAERRSNPFVGEGAAGF